MRGLFNYYSIFCIIFATICYLFNINALVNVNLLLFILQLVFFYYTKNKLEPELSTFLLAPSNILLLGLIIVHLQRFIDVEFGFSSLGEVVKFSYFKEYYNVYYLGIISLQFYLLGLINYGIFKFKVCRIPKFEISFILEKVFLALFIVFFFLFILNIDLEKFLSGAIYQGSGAYDNKIDSSTTYETLFSYLLIINLAIFVKKTEGKMMSIIDFLKTIPIIFIVLCVIYLLLRMLSGDRGPLFYNLLAFFYAIVFVTKVRIKFIFVIFLIFSSAFFISLLNTVRNSVDKNRTFTERLINSYEKENKATEKSVLPVTKELSRSVYCPFVITSGINNKKFEYGYGKYSLWEILTGIPGASSLYSHLGVNLKNMLSSELITKDYNGTYYRTGLGTTAISNFYLDFGFLGVIIGFLIMGIFFGKMDEYIWKNGNKSVPVIIGVLKICSVSIYIGRSSFVGECSKIIYVLILYYSIAFGVSFLKIK